MNMLRWNVNALGIYFSLSIAIFLACAACREQPSRREMAAKPPAPPADKAPAAAPSLTADADDPRAAAPLEAADSPIEYAAGDSTSKYPPIFEQWPKPKLAVVLTGGQNGYIEPCGCSGKENQKGGLSRRDMLLRDLADRGWPTIALDAGGQVKRFGRQAELKYQATIDALKAMNYRAIGFGAADLRLSTAELFALAAPVGDQPTPFVSANVGLFAFDPKVLPRTSVIEAGGMKLGVTSVLGDEAMRKVNNDGVVFKPAAEAVAEVLPQLEAAKCDQLLLLANASLEESRELARKFPQFDIVVTAGGAVEPPYRASKIDGTDTRLIEVGAKGMYAIVLGFYDDPNEPVRYQRVPLDGRFGESERMVQVMASYQDQLRELGLEGLGLKPIQHPSGRQFIGSQACADCHTSAHAVWEKTPHAHALETLEKLTPSRLHDPECLSCHVTGWEPQKYYPFAGGYLSKDLTPLLAGNGCENCHGPATAHVAAESGEVEASDADINRYRNELRLSLDTPAGRKQVIDNCLQCHDADNSLGFKLGDAFDEYWPKVKHEGKY